MSQSNQARVAERLLQVGHMALNRKMLRRGAIKQQNGTLGVPDDTVGEWDDAMDIRVDSPTTINHNYPETTSSPAASAPAEAAAATRDHKTRRGWLLPAALVVGALTGGTVPTALLVYQAITAASESTPPPVIHHDTTRRIDIEKYIPQPTEGSQ